MSANPGTYDFTIYKGATFSRVFTWKDSTGTPVGLTGYTATFVAKPSASYGTNLISLSSGSGITLGGSAGTVTVTIDAETTAAIVEDSMIYSLKLTNGGVVTPLIIGTITVSDEAV